jgi:hypothetical protein
MGSFPKMNWAWWKKKSDSPTTRHDEAIAAPSSKMSPVNSLVKSDSAAPAAEKTRKPYDVPSGPPAPQSFDTERGLAANNSTTASSADGVKFPVSGSANSATSTGLSENSPLMPTPSGKLESDLAKAMKSSPRQPFELSPTNEQDATLNVTGPDSYVPGQSASSTKPANPDPTQRMMSSNPYASGLAQPSDSATPNPSAESNGQYARTPYNEFTPKPGAGGSGASGLATNPLQPKSVDSNTRPIGSIPGPPNLSAGSPTSTIAKVSYTPGSTADSPSVNDLLAGATTQPPTNIVVPSTQPPQPSANILAPSANPAPEGATRIGGGGSFRIVK